MICCGFAMRRDPVARISIFPGFSHFTFAHRCEHCRRTLLQSRYLLATG